MFELFSITLGWVKVSTFVLTETETRITTAADLSTDK